MKNRKFSVHEYVVPEHFMSAIFNNDYSGLTDSEKEQLNLFLIAVDNTYRCNWHFATAEDDADGFFTQYHDMLPFGVLPAKCQNILVVKMGKE